jgi:hypothetical protein
MGMNSETIQKMTEDFIQYVWRFRLLNPELKTVTGETISVLHPGEPNRNGGPDFFNARLRIGPTTWAGNVEVHRKSSDWFRHGHDGDRSYDNVILHVVGTHDAEVTTTGTKPVPVVEIPGNLPERVYRMYLRLLSSTLFVPCENLLSEKQAEPFRFWAPALAVERLEEKAGRINHLLEQSQGNWEEAFYISMAFSFGLRANAQPFELLARSLPLRLLYRYANNRLALEALLYGQAGLLPGESCEEYPEQLNGLYKAYRNKYSLVPLNDGQWKFLRMRPSSFPTVRISQFAAILHRQEPLFGESLSDRSTHDWRGFFAVRASEYWDTHFTFERISVCRKKVLGERSAELILINTVAPFLFLNGLKMSVPGLREKAVTMLEELPAEEDKLVSRWKLLGFPVENAMQTQALKQLKSHYCDRKRCLDCRIGAVLLR